MTFSVATREKRIVPRIQKTANTAFAMARAMAMVYGDLPAVNMTKYDAQVLAMQHELMRIHDKLYQLSCDLNNDMKAAKDELIEF